MIDQLNLYIIWVNTDHLVPVGGKAACGDCANIPQSKNAYYQFSCRLNLCAREQENFI